MVLKETKAVVEEMAVAEGWVDRHEGNSPDFNRITALVSQFPDDPSLRG